VAMTARLLSADARGLWIALQLVYGYAQNLHLGTAFGMFRSVPLLRARGDIAGAAQSKQTTWTFILIMSAIGTAVAIPLVLLAQTQEKRRSYGLTLLLTLISMVRIYYVSVFKAESRFRDLSISAAFGSFTSIATVAMIWLLGLDGLIIGMVLQAIVEVAWLFLRESLPRPGINMAVLRGLLAVGAMTLLNSLAAILLLNVDRTVMLAELGTAATGGYYIGANVLILLPAIAALPAAVLTPRFFEAYGATGSGGSLVDLVERPVRAGSVLFAGCLGGIAIAIPPTVARFLPNLVIGNNAARIALLGTFPLVLSGLVVNVFYAMNRQILQLVLTCAAAGVGFGAARLLVSVHPTIAAVAAGSMLGLATYYAALVVAAYVIMGQPWTRGAKLMVDSLLPAAAAVALVSLSDRVSQMACTPGSVTGALLSEVLFGGAFLPWLVIATKSIRR
jgi:O-antigen/teichoic acid export membrane protein